MSIVPRVQHKPSALTPLPTPSPHLERQPVTRLQAFRGPKSGGARHGSGAHHVGGNHTGHPRAMRAPWSVGIEHRRAKVNDLDAPGVRV